ncbi:hypothetical protein EYF80_007751 [Liparis tanakae]|uniref:Uncharacterized protein n=1 Tax=Liparis tanakae TaxID=230148 RepID=A0A4Z2IVW7_9TELE|nr:hypothetical protein EYF80_007751 [Liparis tanakae]
MSILLQSVLLGWMTGCRRHEPESFLFVSFPAPLGVLWGHRLPAPLLKASTAAATQWSHDILHRAEPAALRQAGAIPGAAWCRCCSSTFSPPQMGFPVDIS